METELTENGINTRLNHKNFVELSAKTPFAKKKKIVRCVDKTNYNILAMFGIEDYTTQSKISIHPEFVAFAFHLYGLPRKLFLYILFFEVNNETCRFTAGIEMKNRFCQFCSLFGEGEKTEREIKQAIKSLVRKNTMISIDDEGYMLNPLIAGGSGEHQRRKLIDLYCQLLTKNGLDSTLNFYPKYQSVI